MHSPEILTATNGALALAVGTFAVWKFPHNFINRSFGIFSLAIAVWGAVYFLPFEKNLIELITAGAISLAAAANFHFNKNLISRSGQNHVLAIVYLVNLFLFGLLAASRLGFLEIFDFDAVWFAGVFTTTVLPIFFLIKSTDVFSGIKKYQLRFILLEYSVVLAVMLGSYFYFWDLEKSFFENIVLSPHFLTSAHLITVFYFFVEWKFLKLKIIGPNVLKNLIAVGLALAGALGLNFFEISHSAILNIIADVVLGIFVYAATLHVFEKRNWLTTISLNNFRQVVEEFKNQNIFYGSVEELEENIQENFSRKIGIEEARVIVLDLEKGEEKYPELEKYFAKSKRYLVTAEEEYLAKNKHVDCPYLDELENLGDVCFPLFQNTNELIGFFVIRREGEDIYIEEELKLLEGGVHYIALSLVAILYTEKLRQQAAKLREDYEKLKTLDNAKDAFIANVSHELRTPATAIKGYAEMLTAPNFGPLSDKQKDFTQRIQKNTNWLLALLADILEITKLENRQIKFDFSEILPSDLLKNLADKWTATCQQKSLSFDFAATIGSNLKLKTDAKYLTEILERLLNNAYKFTDKGGVKLTARENRGFLEIEVVDTGIGIAPNKSEHIWEKFSQGGDFLEKGDQSTGLGLAIVKKLVENLRGDISMQSELGQGSTFTLLIPL
ncbi:MAG: HAMP domain-containing sensor histidine kinase [Patescibacteria group bacterium]